MTDILIKIDYSMNNSVNNNLLPIPIKYTYPIVQKLLSSTGTVKEIYYIPEINKWVRKNALKHVLISNGIDVDYWIDRWLNREGILSENEVNNIVDKLYPSYLIYTRIYVKSILLNKPLTKFSRGLIVKEDWIRLAIISHLNGKYPHIKYDYSKLPDLIPNRNYRVTITCLEINPDTGKLYGDFETSYTCFVTNTTNHPELAKKLSSIERLSYNTETYIQAAKRVHGDKYRYDKTIFKTLKDDVIIYCNTCGKYFKQSAGLHLSGSNCWDCAHKISASSHILGKEEFVRRSIEANGDIYDYSEVVYVDCDTPVKIKNKLTGNIFYQKPKIHVLGHGDGGDISKGEIYIKLWANSNNVEIKSHVYIKLISKARKTERVYVDCVISINSVDYYIEYNGYQHYKETPFFHKTIKDFENQLNRDSELRRYCKEHSIPLIEIPYTYDTYEKVKDLLDRVILGGEDINTIIDYQSLYKI